MIIESKNDNPNKNIIIQAQVINLDEKSQLIEQDEFFASGAEKFLNNLKSFLEECAYLTIEKGALDYEGIVLLERVCRLLKVNFSHTSIDFLVSKLVSLHFQVQGYLSENGFEDVIQCMLKPTNGKSEQSVLVRKMAEYDVLHRILCNTKAKNP